MKRMFAGFLFLCLLVLSLQAFAFADALEQDLYEDWIWEPVVEKDDTLSTGQVTEWACITFGSYPQTEIVFSAFTAVDDYVLGEGDYLEDPVLYQKLADADWNGNEATIDGIRYLRLNREGAVSSAADRSGHYRWDENVE